MTVERIPIKDEAQWLALRRGDVTASVAGCLLGVHEYITPFALWALKSGLVEENPEETPAMKRGKKLEPIAIDLIGEERPRWRMIEPKVYLRDPELRLGATPDLFVEDPDAGFGVVQIKSIEPSVFRRKWRDQETGEIAPPLWIAVQAITEAHLSGAAWAATAALTVGFGLDLEIVPVPIHEGVIARLRAAVAEFWAMVASGKRPDPDWKRDARLIADLYEPTGEIISLESDNELPTLADEKAELTRKSSDIKDRQSEIKAIFLDRLNGATAAKIADGRTITAKRIHKKGYEVQPTEYVDVRVSNNPRAAA